MKLSFSMQVPNNELCSQLVIEQDNSDSVEELYICTLSHYGDKLSTSVPASELANLFELVRSAKITAVGECGIGLDGTSYYLSIENGFAISTYRWWMEPREGWHPLGQITHEMQRLVFKVFGRY